MTLQSYVTQLSVDDQILKSIIGNEGPIYDVDRAEQPTSNTSLCILDNPNNDIRILGPDDFTDFERVSFEVNIKIFFFCFNTKFSY